MKSGGEDKEYRREWGDKGGGVNFRFWVQLADFSMETIWSHLNLIHLYPLSHIQFNIIADLYFTNFIKKKFRSGGGAYVLSWLHIFKKNITNLKTHPDLPGNQRNWVFATNSKPYIFGFQCRRSVRSNNMKFEISKIYNIGFQRYRDYKFRVCGKGSILFLHKS